LLERLPERVFQCPRQKCGHLFIARYELFQHLGHKLSDCVPFKIANTECSDEIAKLSPNFCEIYNQAQKAEQSDWLLVAGPGYRKALEFLIKDYAIKLHPTEEEKIKKMELGRCIQEYMKNEMVRETATRVKEHYRARTIRARTTRSRAPSARRFYVRP
jgi:hypothetical protein